nr:MAG TPA: hypothetical protein [Caudoviricetes sp.]
MSLAKASDHPPNSKRLKRCERHSFKSNARQFMDVVW